MSGDPLLAENATSGRRSGLKASGRWTAENAARLDAAVARAAGTLPSGADVVLDMGEVAAFDTYGAALLARLSRAATEKGTRLSVDGLPERFAGLAGKVADLGALAPMQPAARGWQARLERIGRATEAGLKELLLMLNMLGAVGQAFVGVLRRPRSFRLTATVHQLDRVAWQAVPIIVLITLLIGAIIAQQGFFHFRKFGADQYVVDMVGILVLREIGVLLVAIMVAGRSGSSYTAELGSMKMREEIDALRTMGLDPVAVLILPRVLALVIALPALTLIGMLAALYGGGLVAWLYGDMHPSIYVARLRDAISLTHFEVGLIKAPFMALVIGIVAATEGLKVGGSAQSLGLRTTASVVKAIFLVIVLDGLFAIYFASIGM